jgi:ERCC4-type nuclease
MVLVDERIGSREFLEPLRNLGVDADLARLDADFQWVGNGPDGAVLVGVERKEIGDFLTSMRDRRLGGKQAIDMGNTYDIQYLLVEGAWRRGAGGVLETLKGRNQWASARGSFKWAEAVSFMTSLEELYGMRLWRCFGTEDTCATVAAKYQWWQKPWSEHKSDRQVYAPEPQAGTGRRARAFRHTATLLERWLCALPGVDGRALELAKYFSSGHDMATASVERWLTVPGLRIGKKTAETIVGAVRGEDSV